MKKNYDILFIHRIYWLILVLFTFLILLTGSITLLMYGNLIVGSIFTCIISLFILIYMITQPMFIKIDNETIKVLNFFGLIKKEKHLKDLKEIYIDFLKVGGRNGDEYICLNFNSNVFTFDSFENGQNNSDLIIFYYSKKSETIIKRNTNLNIIDKR